MDLVKVTNLIMFTLITLLLIKILLLPPLKEEFDILYILDENSSFDNIPTQVRLGQELKIKIGVYNGRDKEMNYSIRELIENKERRISLGILGKNNALLVNESITFNETGVKRIIFELWQENNYLKRSTDIWINVT